VVGRVWKWRLLRAWRQLRLGFGGNSCRNPTLRECEDEAHTPKVGTRESSENPDISEFNYKGQNTLHWSVFYIIGKLFKFTCRKWPCMGHLNICNTSYGKKKGRESN